MKIYKFKDLADDSTHDHLFQIIDENKVWCAAPESLNDENEFDFKMDYNPTGKTELLLSNMIVKFGQKIFPPHMTASYALLNNKLEEITSPIVGDIVSKCRSTIGVTSFSAVGSGTWLWEKYGGMGNGAVVELELSEERLGNTFHPIEYVSNKIFHVDLFLESHLSDSSRIFKKILCTKTKQWGEEQEIRFLGKTPNVSVTFDASVSGVIIGNKVSDSLKIKIENHSQKRGIDVEHQG